MSGEAEAIAAVATLAPPEAAMEMREVIKLRGALALVELTLPDASLLRSSGLRKFAHVQQEFTLLQDRRLRSNIGGQTLTRDPSRGFIVNEQGAAVPPGWRVNIGWGNFERIFTSPGIRAPMLSIFIWAVAFASLSVGLTFAIGLTLAMILQWPHLKAKTAYRLLLILPYAVPGFILILVFRGLFNHSFGEINMILEALFGIRPAWVTDGNLARLMLVIVNVWSATRADGTVIQPPYPVLLWMWNSVKVGMIAAIGIVSLSTISAYAFSRIRFKGRTALLDTLFIIQMFPTTLALVALFAIFDGLGEVTPALGTDSHWALILTYMSGITLHIWTIKGYFDNLDPAMDKAAQIDGASPWQTFRFIFLPLAVPIVAVVFVLSFIGVVNDFPIASVLLRSEDQMTLAVGSRLYLNKFKYLWGDLAAAAILSGRPITMVFMVAQKHLVAGLSEGAVKG